MGAPGRLADFYIKIVYFNGAGGAGGEVAGTRNFRAKSCLYNSRHDFKTLHDPRVPNIFGGMSIFKDY